MDPLAIGCIVGFVLVGGGLIVGCYRNKPKMAKSSSGADLVGAVAHADVDPVEF